MEQRSIFDKKRGSLAPQLTNQLFCDTPIIHLVIKTEFIPQEHIHRTNAHLSENQHGVSK